MKKLDNVQFDGDQISPSRRRRLKMNSLIRVELDKIMIRELEMPPQVLLTVTRVDLPADYSQAKIGLSVLPPAAAERVLALVQAKRGLLQRLLNDRLHIYRVPKLVFHLDDIEEKADNLNRLLDSLS